MRSVFALARVSALALALIATGMPAASVQAAPSTAAIGWGLNALGQVGDGTFTDRQSPVPVNGLASVVSVAAGEEHSLALKSDGTVLAWGTGFVGQLGISGYPQTAFPQTVSGLNDAVAISAGEFHNLALKRDGSVVAWGNNSNGELGDGTQTTRFTPVGVSGLHDATAIAAGGDHSLAIKSDGTVAAWGYNGLGQLGDGTTTDHWTPAQVSGLTGVIAIAAGRSHSLALKRDGSVVAWGLNYFGQLGDGTLMNRTAPTPVLWLTGATAIAAGGFHSLALRADKSVSGWGESNHGQIGPVLLSTFPETLNGLTNVSAIAAGFSHTLALRTDGTVLGLGGNQYGQLGDGTTNDRFEPVKSRLINGTAIAAGYGHSLAVAHDIGAPSALALNGATSYAEVPATPDLNLTGGWTVEAWFKDEDPGGFNHDWRQIVMKGDRDAYPEAPYYILVGYSHLLAGVRTGGNDYPIDYNLAAGGLSPFDWHHVAVTFLASRNALSLYVDGQYLQYISVPAHSTAGNSLPLEIGRNGPASGKYWLGKIADLRIWYIERTAFDIASSYWAELSSPQPGLITNWHLDETSGNMAADTAGGHTATLLGGATFANDPHP